MHHCIQGWSGIAQWSGLPLATLAELVRPKPEAKVAVFRSFGEGLYGGEYYDTQQLENALQTQCILAYEMNYEPLAPLYGAPLRLRVENQLGYKMVKWVKAIEFVASEKQVGKGHGGKNEDDEFFEPGTGHLTGMTEDPIWDPRSRSATNRRQPCRAMKGGVPESVGYACPTFLAITLPVSFGRRSCSSMAF